MAGRPTKYNETILVLSNEYLENYEEHGDMIPSDVGLCLVLGIARSTLYDWASQESKKAFSDILENINMKQQKVLINKGLSSEFNSNITKLVLGKHGYHEKIDQQSTMNVSISNEDAKTL